MKYRFALPLFLAAFLLQTTVMNHFKVFGTAPNLILCCLIILTFFFEGYSGGVLAILFGLLQDVCFGVIVGPSAISYFAVFLLMKQLRYLFYRDSIFSVLCAAVVGTVPALLLNWAIVAAFGGVYHISYVLKDLPVLIVYHFIVILAFYLLWGRRMIRRHPEDSYR
ncbi:MAG: rod shape-determining protein MreD [Anaerovoracaceae bacterium]|nr:rod shape-determining protein MreD [Bacillota bacterium]MDY3955125.1 rod shape-determining protein MreD [Anaerovoracaceae bacterium]